MRKTAGYLKRLKVTDCQFQEKQVTSNISITLGNCSRDVLNRLKHKELPLTAAFQDQILPLALCDLTEISSSEEAPCTDKLGFFSATQFSHCIWLNPQTAGTARDGKRFGQPFSGLHLFTRAATQTINGKGPTASYIYNPKKRC